MISIRKAEQSDYEAVWGIFSEVIASGETYVFSPNTKKEELAEHWFSKSMQTFVAESEEGVLGTYILKANALELGSHVANASYMVSAKARGKGLGRLLGEHSIMQAKKSGFLAIQFNYVVSTNTVAVKLWKSLGFEIVGTVPEAHKHPTLSYVDIYVMYQKI